MAIVMVNDGSLSNIANAIRNKIGSNNLYTPSQMAGVINGMNVVPPPPPPPNYAYINAFNVQTTINTFMVYTNVNETQLNSLAGQGNTINITESGCSYKSLLVNLSNMAAIYTAGDEVVYNANMTYTFNNCTYMNANLQNMGNFDRVTNMYNTFMNCQKLIGNPVSCKSVVNMRYAYWNCFNITGKPTCSNVINDCDGAYYSCRNIIADISELPLQLIIQEALSGTGVYGNLSNTGSIKLSGMSNVKINLDGAIGCVPWQFYNCKNAYGKPNIVWGIKNGYYMFYNCGLTNINLYDLYWLRDCTHMFDGCWRLNVTLNSKYMQNITDMGYMFNSCSMLKGNPVCGPYVDSFFDAYAYCGGLTGNPVCGANVNMAGDAYKYCTGLTGSPVCGANVTSAGNMYRGCKNLTGKPVCGALVKYTDGMYEDCTNLTGSPVCSANATYASNMYRNCYNITGKAVCGALVGFADNMYANCTKINNTPVCGANVLYANYMYYNCPNITGAAPIGTNVKNAYRMYGNCIKLTGVSAVNTYNCNNYQFTFENCRNITGAVRLLYNKNTYYYECGLKGMFYNHSNAKRLNIFVKKGYAIDNALQNYPSYYGNLLNGLYSTSTGSSYKAGSITWTNMTNGYYNTLYNIYVYNNA